MDHLKNPISATTVIGANALSEVGASFVAFASHIPSGFFGGRSRKYENKLQGLYKSLVESLKQSARSYRADAIIGFRLVFRLDINFQNTEIFVKSV
ncbi:heavy metal-binding domain-containing protein [Sphingobacterium faecium]|uniref:heavy metal-binding domain-containing protein n=1 Tax=Sphingobacterium faecium TaxID=34087 RepID=UPI003DA2A3D8